MTYSAEVTKQANEMPALGGEYFEAREVAERFMAHWAEEHAEQFAEAIIKPVLDQVQDKVWDAFREFLMSDTEQNIQTEMRRMVESTVGALIGGDKWANVKYLQSPYGDGQKVRATLAKLHSDDIKDGRIADLEAEVERLKKDLEFYRRHF